MIMLVSALMCVRRKRPLSDAGGVQLSKLVASMGEHLSSARRTGEGASETTASSCSHTGGQMGGKGFYGGGVFGRHAKSLNISSQQRRFVTKYKRLRF